MAVTLQKLIVAQEVDFNNLSQEAEQLRQRAQYLQDTGNTEDKKIGDAMMEKVSEKMDVVYDLREEIDTNRRNSGR